MTRKPPQSNKRTDGRAFPAEGGSYVRDRNGALKQTAKPTAPNPGKTARALEAAAKVSSIDKRRKAPQDTAQPQEKDHE